MTPVKRFLTSLFPALNNREHALGSSYYHLFNILHLVVHRCDGVGTFQKFHADKLMVFVAAQLFFVAVLVFQAGPEIHAYGPYLHFGTHGSFSLCEEYRNLYDHVIASVAIGLRVQDIILDADDLNIVLFSQKIGNRIDVIYEGADDTDPCHIV